MNRIKTYCVLGFLCFVASVSARDVNAIFSINDRFSDSEVESQITNLSDVIDLKYTSEVKALINIYISAGRPNSEAMLSRSNYYFPIMDNIIQRHNLPQELKYLSVVESGLRPTVRSKAGAVGLWQFISSTAKMYDLKIASFQDDRQDVAKSTEAALLYLNDLHERFGNWGLALAAYNCGPGNVNKAIRKSGGKKTYWEIRKYLPKETRRYMPKFVATMYVMNYFEQYGLNGSKLSFTEHSSFGLATLNQKTNFSQISSQTGLKLSEIRKFNPSYKANYIPRSTKGNTLILPETYLLAFLASTNQLDKIKDVFYTQGSTFTLPEAAMIEEVIRVENTRTTIQTEIILTQVLSELPYSTALKLNADMTPTIAAVNPTQMIRLRKRQSMLDYLLSSKYIEEHQLRPQVSSEGVMSIKR